MREPERRARAPCCRKPPHVEIRWLAQHERAAQQPQGVAASHRQVLCVCDAECERVLVVTCALTWQPTNSIMAEAAASASAIDNLHAVWPCILRCALRLRCNLHLVLALPLYLFTSLLASLSALCSRLPYLFGSVTLPVYLSTSLPLTYRAMWRAHYILRRESPSFLRFEARVRPC
jgi:hypothetical protein